VARKKIGQDESQEQHERRQSAGIQSVEIGMSVLEAFARSRSAMSLKQVCQDLDMAPSKVHRYLVSFVRSGMLTQHGANGLYDLGPTARRLGMTAMGRLDSVAAASKEVLWLRDITDQTVCLTIWGDAGPTLIRWESGSTPLLMTIRVGSLLPLAESAIGRLFLAHMPRATVQPVLKRQRQLAGLKGDRPSLSEEQIEEIRTARSIHLVSALIAGVDAIAAPVFDAEGELSSVICLLAPHQAAVGEAAKELYRNIEEAARRISYELGYYTGDSAREGNERSAR
jgi:DNA-binding IclR family transcriptional regulator